MLYCECCDQYIFAENYDFSLFICPQCFAILEDIDYENNTSGNSSTAQSSETS